MDNSPFRRLSAELRNRIYELTFSGTEGITIECTKSGVSKNAKITSPHISLALTCREIRQESLQMLYSSGPVTIRASAADVRRDGLPSSEEIPGWAVRTTMIAHERLVGKVALSEVRRVNLKLLCRFRVDELGLPSHDTVKVRRMRLKQIHDVRAMFHPLAHFEVHFEVEGTKSWRPHDNATFNVVWDIDQPFEQFKQRVNAERRKSMLNSHLPYTIHDLGSMVKQFVVGEWVRQNRHGVWVSADT